MMFNHLRFIEKKPTFLNFTICSTEAHPDKNDMGRVGSPRLRLLNSCIQDLSIGWTINSFYKLIRYQKHFGKNAHNYPKMVKPHTLSLYYTEYIFFCFFLSLQCFGKQCFEFTPENFGGTELIQPDVAEKHPSNLTGTTKTCQLPKSTDVMRKTTQIPKETSHQIQLAWVHFER